MKAPAGLRVGACTHTGLVRGANEDDYLLATPTQVPGSAFLAAVADGMGGAAGGAEASRTDPSSTSQGELVPASSSSSSS